MNGKLFMIHSLIEFDHFYTPLAIVSRTRNSSDSMLRLKMTRIKELASELVMLFQTIASAKLFQKNNTVNQCKKIDFKIIRPNLIADNHLRCEDTIVDLLFYQGKHVRSYQLIDIIGVIKDNENCCRHVDFACAYISDNISFKTRHTINHNESVVYSIVVDGLVSHKVEHGYLNFPGNIDFRISQRAKDINSNCLLGVAISDTHQCLKSVLNFKENRTDKITYNNKLYYLYDGEAIRPEKKNLIKL